jgi:PAS domain S-box-containing protein
MNKTRTRDLMIAVAIGVIALLAAIYFYAFESLAAWVQRHDEWQVDALLLLPIILVTVLALYYWRKHGQLEGEVAERRRMEETLRQQRDLYEGMLTAQSELGEGLVVIEVERIRYANDAFCEISGYGAEELKALPGFMELVAEDERAQILERQRRRREGEGVETHFDTALRCKDGRRVDIEVAFKVRREHERDLQRHRAGRHPDHGPGYDPAGEGHDDCQSQRDHYLQTKRQRERPRQLRLHGIRL